MKHSEIEQRTILSNALIFYRICNNLTQEEAAQIAKVDRTSYCAWETGKNMPNLFHLAAFSDFYGINLESFLHNPILDGELFSKKTFSYATITHITSTMKYGLIRCKKKNIGDSFPCGDYDVSIFDNVIHLSKSKETTVNSNNAEVAQLNSDGCLSVPANVLESVNLSSGDRIFLHYILNKQQINLINVNNVPMSY